MSGAAECGPVVVWAVGLCAVAGGFSLLAALPRTREGLHVGLSGGIAAGLFSAVVWYVTATCEAC